MTYSPNINPISIINYVIGVIGAGILLFSGVRNQNYKDLKDRVKILEDNKEEAKQQHLDNQKAIALLQGKLEAYKEIPLRDIADSLSLIATTLNVNLPTKKVTRTTISKKVEQE